MKACELKSDAKNAHDLGSRTLDYEEALTFKLETEATVERHNSTILMAKSEAEKSEWKSIILSAIQQALKNHKLSLQDLSLIARMQLKVKNVYTSRTSEYFFGSIIMTTYLMTIVQYQPTTTWQLFANYIRQI
jgi:hypothetical protein